jgi:hypothetical protein
MLAIIAALLFLIAFIIELIYDNGADTLLITAGFLLVALYLGGWGLERCRLPQSSVSPLGATDSPASAGVTPTGHHVDARR